MEAYIDEMLSLMKEDGNIRACCNSSVGGINILLLVYGRYYELKMVFHSIFDQAQLTSYSWHFS